jgi:hypothetical protein
MRWNYAEWCARQILRKDASGLSLDDTDQLAISKLQALRIESQLKGVALPKWTGSGKQYLDRLIDTFAIAREHRNHFVHGIYATTGVGAPPSAWAILIPTKPKNNKTQIPTHTTLAEMRVIAEHIHDLAMFAREVMLGFDERGNRALNQDGSPVIEELPVLITPLPPCTYLTT